MSHHDDNLYTILGKLAALQPKPEIKTSKEAAKKIYESVEARGSILSGVDAVQAKLAKQFAMERDESKLKKGHCSDCDCSPCKCEKCNECGMLESKCQCKQDITEGAMSEIHMELSQVAQDEDYDRLSELMSDSGLVGQYLQHQVEDITSETGLHPDDDFEEIENRLMDRIQSNFGDDDDVAEGGKTPKQYWNRDSQSIGSTPDDGLTYADPDEDGVHYPDYGNTKFQQQAKPKPTQATSANKRLTDKQYAKQLHKHYASLYDTLRITFNRRKNIFSVTGDNGFETDYHKYRVDPTTNKLKIMMSTSVENESVNPGVVEDFATLRHYKAFGVDLVERIASMDGVEVQPDDDAMTSATITIDVQGNPDEAKELADMAKQGKIKPVGGPTTRDMVGKARRTGTKYITTPAVAEASYINGKEEDPKSLRWKQTSMTQQQAITKYGKENVRVTRGGLRNGDDMVEVKVPLGEQGVAEGETVVKGNVSTHKGTYGNEYQGDPDDDDGKPAPKAPKVSNSKTGKKGRPTGTGKNQQTTGRKYDHSALSSILGGSAPKNKVKGTVHKMDESMDQVARRLTEGVNLLELLKEKHQTVDEMLAELSTDIANFKESGHCSELLKDCMDIKGAHKKAEPFTALDIAPAHAITPDATRLPHEFNSRPMEMDRELNELARLAGLSEDCGDMPPIGIAMQDMQSEQDNLSISTTYNSRDGKKTISVNADGKQAEDLLQMLRIAGLGSGEKAQELQVRPGIEFDNIDGEASTVPQDDLEELPVDMQMHQDDAEMDEAEFDAPALEPVNGPKPEYKTMKQSTMGPGEGDGGEKAMHPDRPTNNNGDNALSTPATPPTRAQKTLIAVSTLESKLAAEYESIKKSK